MGKVALDGAEAALRFRDTTDTRALQVPSRLFRGHPEDVRLSRVLALRAAIAAGDYCVPSFDVAERMMQSMRSGVWPGAPSSCSLAKVTRPPQPMRLSARGPGQKGSGQEEWASG